MNSNYSTVILTLIVFSFSAGAVAKNMSKSEYKTAGKKIVTEYKTNHKSCTLYAHRYKSRCFAEAKRTEIVEKKKLETIYRPSSKASYAVGY